MNVEWTEPERQHLRQVQKQRRDDEGYVKVTLILLLDKGRRAESIAEDLGLDESTVYRYAQAWQRLGLDKYLLHERPGYWGLLPSAGLAALSRQVEQTLYTDVWAIGAWFIRHWGVHYSVSGLTQVLHRLGFSYKLTTSVPCEADGERPATFLAEQLQPLLEAAAAGQAVVYFADAAHPPHTLDQGLDPHWRAAPAAHRQRAGAGKSECGGQRPLSHAGASGRNNVRQRPE